MNPAAAIIGGRTHLVYRAIGVDGVSRLGYASSPNGITFDKRLPYPVYVAQEPRNLPGHAKRYSPVLYPSGGSWGGCEDPRMVVIEGRVYITFNMFDGWDYIRVASISIAEEDFLSGQFWKWDGPHILSEPKQIHKNWVLFPEKIRGKYAILHSIVPKVDIAYRDSIEDIGMTEPYITSWVGARDDLPARENSWDSFIRGAGTATRENRPRLVAPLSRHRRTRPRSLQTPVRCCSTSPTRRRCCTALRLLFSPR